MSTQSNSFNSGERETVIALAVLNLLERELDFWYSHRALNFNNH